MATKKEAWAGKSDYCEGGGGRKLGKVKRNVLKECRRRKNKNNAKPDKSAQNRYKMPSVQKQERERESYDSYEILSSHS